MRAVIYARYSSENQRDASIEDQLEVCRRFVERQSQDSCSKERFSICSLTSPLAGNERLGGVFRYFVGLGHAGTMRSRLLRTDFFRRESCYRASRFRLLR
jgi:hypothetical protein